MGFLRFLLAQQDKTQVHISLPIEKANKAVESNKLLPDRPGAIWFGWQSWLGASMTQ